ncbi:hypothetical protein [Chryseobacterium chendengshani]|uniref:hypothetical protein n=1 Tax=Chryseobacterium sp. LJ756 TaxID=2864113 RepID=UPI001C64100C|nr:hypothetical protein [Chryseobacterium sp. LJ756]MBW7675860.1 hypothetical protein [Chryseobacterium sp. LJ756]
MKDKIKVFATLTLLMCGLYGIYKFLENRRSNDIELINKDFKIIDGIVVKKSVQKGNSLRVKYIVNGRVYIESDGFLESQKVNIGDSIRVKYSIDKPELIIIEFNDYF